MSTIIALTPEMIRIAEAYEAAIEKTRTIRRRSNYTSFEAKRRYFCGYLGELAFLKLLQDAGKEFVHHVDKTGKKVDRKFVLHDRETGAPISVNVATSSSQKHANVAYPKEKLLRSWFDYLVAVRLDYSASIAEVWGYVSKREISLDEPKDLGYGNFCYLYPLYKLEPVNNLLTRIREKESHDGAAVS